MPLPPALPSNFLPYPVLKGNAWPKWTPQFFNQSSIASSGASINLALTQYPLHLFELNYEFLRDTRTASGVTLGNDLSDFTTLMGFFLTQGGTLGRFAYSNPADNRATGMQIAVGDGSTVVFPITRTIVSGYTVNTATERVGFFDPNVNVNVYIGTAGNPVLQNPASYTLLNNGLSNLGGVVSPSITFNGPPPAGQLVTMDFGYMYYCRFAEDIQQFEQFTSVHWLAATVKLQSCRPGA
jgi:hypothetical protein